MDRCPPERFGGWAALALLVLVGCRAHTSAVTTETTAMAAEATSMEPSPPTLPSGPLTLELSWSHDSNCSQSFAYVQLSHRFQLDVDGAGPVSLVLDQRHQDSSGPAAGAADFATAQRTHYDTEKRYTWNGRAASDGVGLRLQLRAGTCEVLAPEDFWVVMGCPEVVPRLDLDCRATTRSDLPSGYEVHGVGGGLLRCDTSSPDELPFSLWGLQEPLVFSTSEGLQASFYRGDNIIEGELIRPEE